MAIAWQHARTERLAREVRQLEEEARSLSLLKAEKVQLTALQISPTELAQLRQEHQEIEKLRASLVRLGSSSAAYELTRRYYSNTHPKRSSEDNGAPVSEPFAHFAGNQTPKATLDSIIWASKSGDVDALTPLITFDAAGRENALKLFQSLPIDLQTQYGSPEKTYATLLAANIPLGLSSASTGVARTIGEDTVVLSTRLERGGRNSHDVDFVFRRNGSAWQLVVPDYIVENYARELTAIEAR